MATDAAKPLVVEGSGGASSPNKQGVDLKKAFPEQKAAYVLKKGSSTMFQVWNKKIIVLDSSLARLYVYENATDPRPQRSLNIEAACEVARMYEPQIGEHRTDKVALSFKLSTSEREYIFSCGTGLERDDWIVSIQRVIDAKAAPPPAPEETYVSEDPYGVNNPTGEKRHVAKWVEDQIGILSEPRSKKRSDTADRVNSGTKSAPHRSSPLAAGASGSVGGGSAPGSPASSTAAARRRRRGYEDSVDNDAVTGFETVAAQSQASSELAPSEDSGEGALDVDADIDLLGDDVNRKTNGTAGPSTDPKAKDNLIPIRRNSVRTGSNADAAEAAKSSLITARIPDDDDNGPTMTMEIAEAPRPQSIVINDARVKKKDPEATVTKTGAATTNSPAPNPAVAKLKGASTPTNNNKNNNTAQTAELDGGKSKSFVPSAVATNQLANIESIVVPHDKEGGFLGDYLAVANGAGSESSEEVVFNVVAGSVEVSRSAAASDEEKSGSSLIDSSSGDGGPPPVGYTSASTSDGDDDNNSGSDGGGGGGGGSGEGEPAPEHLAVRGMRKQRSGTFGKVTQIPVASRAPASKSGGGKDRPTSNLAAAGGEGDKDGSDSDSPPPLPPSKRRSTFGMDDFPKSKRATVAVSSNLRMPASARAEGAGERRASDAPSYRVIDRAGGQDRRKSWVAGTGFVVGQNSAPAAPAGGEVHERVSAFFQYKGKSMKVSYNIEDSAGDMLFTLQAAFRLSTKTRIVVRDVEEAVVHVLSGKLPPGTYDLDVLEE